ncbi:MAG: hypothetical protein JSU77_08590 [Fidelibacterota bacterium]|nr:MAG: hypothetical protein JSU77_08590 [Candidatus Neomarinimicrobiota bacterium]
MTLRVAVGVMILWGLAQGSTPEAGCCPQPFQPVAKGLLNFSTVQQDVSLAHDSLSAVDVTSPYYRYPGRVLMMSLAVPGAGQLYVGRPMRTVFFLGAEIIALMAWRNYTRQGEGMTQDFRDFANDHWDFNRWLNNAQYYQSDPWGSGEGRIYIGTDGSHHLEYFLDMDDDGRPEFFGNTIDDSKRLFQLLADPDTSIHVGVKRSGEYYENIGKYNQFFSGWEDADPNNPDIEERESGLIALSEHRSQYLQMRADANRLKSIAGYAISAIMFNHVVSAIDAIFATSRWNNEHARHLSGRLWFSPASPNGVGGMQISLTW